MTNTERGAYMPEGNINTEGSGMPPEGAKPGMGNRETPSSLRDAARAAIERAGISGVRQKLVTETGVVEKGGPTFEAHVPHLPRRVRGSIKQGGTRPDKIIGPTPQEAEEFIKGLAKPSRWKRLADSKAARTITAILGLPAAGGAVLEVGHAINPNIPDVPGVYRAVDENVANAINAVQDYRESLEPSGGEVFNPRARSGEISSSNTIQLSKEEATDLINRKTAQDKKLYFILPATTETLTYKTKTGPYNDSIEIAGLKAGDKIVSPYDGTLRWQKYPGGIMVIDIKISGDPIDLDDDTKNVIRVALQEGNAKLLIPDENFNISNSGTTIYSSEVPVSAGQDVIAILSEETALDPNNGRPKDYQILLRWGNILSEDNKAIAISP